MLLADVAVAARVGTRIFPHPAPQDVASPFLTYQVVGADQVGATYTHRSTFDVNGFQIDCWHEQMDRVPDGTTQFYGDVAALANDVRTALDRKGDPLGDEAIESIDFDDWNDLGDTEYARRTMRFAVYVRDP